MKRLLPHRFAKLFPLLVEAEANDLREDIRMNGVRDQIVMLDGEILDGVNRYGALVFLVESGEVLGPGWGHRAGEPLDADHLLPDHSWFRKFNASVEGDPLTWVLSKNLHRRHLSVGQRAWIVAQIETISHGGDRKSADQDANLQLDRQTLAARADVSERTVASAAKVRDEGVPELQQAVAQGDIAPSAAEAIASLPKSQQQDLVLALPRDESGALTPEARKNLGPLIREVRGIKQREKAERREQREADLGRKILALPDQKFGLVLSDYEWDHEPYSRETGMDRHPSNHYPTSVDAHTPEEIAARIAERMSCAAQDCVWLCWTTIPHLAIALRVVELLGFTYKSHIVWNKVRPGNGRGPGYWVTGEHELLLICTRGKVVAPSTAHFRSSFEAPVGEHSEKPDFQYEFAEFHFPNLPKVELNARRARAGWYGWGFEAEEAQPVDTAEVIGTAGDYAILRGPSFVPKDFLTEGEARSLLAFEQLPEVRPIVPLDGACCDRDHGPLDTVIALPDDFRLGQELGKPAPDVAEHECQTARAKETKPADGLDIPAFLRRGPDNRIARLN